MSTLSGSSTRAERQSDLTKRVKDDFFSDLNGVDAVSISRNQFRVYPDPIFKDPSSSNSDDKVQNLKITRPVVQSCKPRVSIVSQQAAGIYCQKGTQKECSYKYASQWVQSYSLAQGAKYSATLTTSAGGKIGPADVSVEVSLSKEKSTERTWQTSTGETFEYNFVMNPGTACTPSLAHVDLQCEGEIAEYNFPSLITKDNGKEKFSLNTKVKNDCKTAKLLDDPAFDPENWKPLVKDSLGAIYVGDVTKLRTAGANDPKFSSMQIVIGRAKGSGDYKEVFVCNAAYREDAAQVIVPLHQGKNVPLGYISCV